jgi:hypothetical protein
MCLLMEDSEPMELLRNVEANGLGLLTRWDHLVARRMAGLLSKVAFIATLIRIMLSDSRISVLKVSEMEIHVGRVGLEARIRVQ